ncbi:MAG: Ig-like domain-containing protein [Pseudonocardiaceae bacterium]
MNRLSRVAVVLTFALGVLVPVATASARADPIRGLIVITRGMANAPSSGSLTITPPTGSDYNAPTARTSGPCPTTADSAVMLLTGPVGVADPTFPPGNPFLILTTSQVDFSTTDSFDQPFRLTLRDAAADRGKTLKAGEYRLTTQCVNGLTQQVFGTFTGAIFFTSPTVWQTNDPNGPEIVSTTTLTTSSGTEQTLTATISPPAAAAGTVRFKDGDANIGDPVKIPTSTDNVSITTSLMPGTHSLSAVFTPKAVKVTGSTSQPATFVVAVAPAATSPPVGAPQGAESGPPAAAGELVSARDAATGRDVRWLVLTGVALVTVAVVTLVAVAVAGRMRKRRTSGP